MVLHQSNSFLTKLILLSCTFVVGSRTARRSGHASAFLLPRQPHGLTSRSTIVVAKVASASISDFPTVPQLGDAIEEKVQSDTSMLQGTSAAAKKLRMDLDDLSTNTDYPNVVLAGPRGAGETGIVTEIIEHRMPAWQSQTVNRISMDDAVSFMEVVLGSPEQDPKGGLLGQWANEPNTTLVFQGISSLFLAVKVEKP